MSNPHDLHNDRSVANVYNCPSCGEETICTTECEGLRVAFRDMTHRVEVAEQELRETAGELEKARARVTEATALLDDLDWAICGEGPRYHVEPELKHRLAEWRNAASRAPAQPARSQPTIAELTEQSDGTEP